MIKIYDVTSHRSDQLFRVKFLMRNKAFSTLVYFFCKISIVTFKLFVLEQNCSDRKELNSDDEPIV